MHLNRLSNPPTPAARRPPCLPSPSEWKQTCLRKILFAPPEQSIGWIESAARLGLAEAQLLLGQMLLEGIFIRRDRKAAFAWFSVAANAGHKPAIAMVGQCLQNGWGTIDNTTAPLSSQTAAPSRAPAAARPGLSR